METESEIIIFNKLILKELRTLVGAYNSSWNLPIAETIKDIRETGASAVLFGGSLRSLLHSRLAFGKPGRPRDIDIVVSNISMEKLTDVFEKYIVRKTRFGGLQIKRNQWSFDIWPLEKTWAFTHDNRFVPLFDSLPMTTFLNIEAIAVDLFVKKGKRRKIYQGDRRFYNAFKNRVVEINYPDNPYPELNAIRGLLMASSLNFQIGPKLAKHIFYHGLTLVEKVEEIQLNHYGARRELSGTIIGWIKFIKNQDLSLDNNISLPLQRSVMLPLDIEYIFSNRLWELVK